MSSRHALIADLEEVPNCRCGGQHLIDNLRDLIYAASDDSSGWFELDDCDCACCRWLAMLTASS